MAPYGYDNIPKTAEVGHLTQHGMVFMSGLSILPGRMLVSVTHVDYLVHKLVNTVAILNQLLLLMGLEIGNMSLVQVALLISMQTVTVISCMEAV